MQTEQLLCWISKRGTEHGTTSGSNEEEEHLGATRDFYGKLHSHLGLDLDFKDNNLI